MPTIVEVFPPPVGEFRARNKLVYGVGLNDWPGPTYQDGKHWYVYHTWASMLQRAYATKYHARYPTYVGVSVCDEWHSFSAFATWLMAQPHFEKGQLDKDLLVLRNKVYCPERCLIVPGWLNNLPTDRGAARGALPIWVCEHKGRFRAQVCLGNGKQKFLGDFNTPEEAFRAAKAAKLAYVASLREQIEAVRPGLYACVVAKVLDIYREDVDLAQAT